MTINLGGLQAAHEERIYFEDARFILDGGEEVVVARSEIPGVNMADLFARHKARYYLPALFCRPGPPSPSSRWPLWAVGRSIF